MEEQAFVNLLITVCNFTDNFILIYSLKIYFLFLNNIVFDFKIQRVPLPTLTAIILSSFQRCQK